MGTRARLNLYLALTFLLVFCTSSAVLYRSLMDGAVAEVRRESTLRMEMALAVRKYTIEEVRPLLQQAGQTYRPPAVPAHAAIRSMALLEQDHPEYRYREVALNPINPANRATGWQEQLIRDFGAEPEKTELTRFTEGPTGQVMHVARVVRPSADCMACHGPSDHMPADLLQRYGTQGAGWQLGETVGAQIVSVPMAQAIAQAREAWWWHVATTIVVFGALFIVLNRMLSHTVIAPIENRSTVWRELASKDPLTGALNRRSFEEQAKALMGACSAKGAPLALVAVDIDHFKRVNDSHGHAVGDAVLKEFAQRMLQATKRRDCLFRLGGEEFALLLPHTDLAAAAALAEVLRRSLGATPFSGVGRLSASFGVSALLPGDGLEALMCRADQALYAAKAKGRDRVECAAFSGPEPAVPA